MTNAAWLILLLLQKRHNSVRRPVDFIGFANNIFLGEKAPKMRVSAVVAIVTQDKVGIGRNGLRPPLVAWGFGEVVFFLELPV